MNLQTLATMAKAAMAADDIGEAASELAKFCRDHAEELAGQMGTRATYVLLAESVAALPFNLLAAAKKAQAHAKLGKREDAWCLATDEADALAATATPAVGGGVWLSAPGMARLADAAYRAGVDWIDFSWEADERRLYVSVERLRALVRAQAGSHAWGSAAWLVCLTPECLALQHGKRGYRLRCGMVRPIERCVNVHVGACAGVSHVA